MKAPGAEKKKENPKKKAAVRDGSNTAVQESTHTEKKSENVMFVLTFVRRTLLNQESKQCE